MAASFPDHQDLRLSIGSQLDAVPLLATATRAVCSMALPEDQARQVERAVVEAATNVIRHSYLEERGHELALTIGFAADRINFALRDAGRPPPPHLLARAAGVFEFDCHDIGALPERGMGVAIMEACVDDIVYRSENGINLLTFTKARGRR